VTAMLEAINLSKSFGGLQALQQISLRIESGESIGVIGPNGAGKTTLFNLLTGELKADGGQVCLDGVNIDSEPIHRRVKLGLARTYQVPRPFAEISVRENIRVSMMEDSIRSMLKLNRDDKGERSIAQSVGLSVQHLGQLPSELAMGDLRKLELARTLATDPKVLLLDEVFAGLTYGEIENISDLLVTRRKTHGTTYLIVSHDLKALEHLVDGVIVVHSGSIIKKGSFVEAIEDPQVQNAYLGTG